MRIVKMRIAAFVALVTASGLLASGCSEQQPCSVPGSCSVPAVVLAQVDASPSGLDGGFYFRKFAEVLASRDGEPLEVSLMAIGATTDPAEVCPTLSSRVMPDPGANDPSQAWKRSARSLLAGSRSVFECAEGADSQGSAIAGLEHARGVDELWLFSDAMLNDGEIKLKRSRLDDAQYVTRVSSRLPAGDALAGVSVRVYGAGVNSKLTNTQLAGLRQIIEALVAAQGGALDEWVTF